MLILKTNIFYGENTGRRAYKTKQKHHDYDAEADDVSADRLFLKIKLPHKINFDFFFVFLKILKIKLLAIRD